MERPEDSAVGLIPFRYSDEEIVTLAAEIQTLMKTPEWDSFIRVMNDMVHGAREQGFADTASILRWKGFVEGVEAVYEMALWLPLRAKEMFHRDEVMAERSTKRTKGHFSDDYSKLTI